MGIYLCMTLKVSKKQEWVSCFYQVDGASPWIGNSGVLGTAVSTEDGKPSVLLTEVMIINTLYVRDS